MQPQTYIGRRRPLPLDIRNPTVPRGWRYGTPLANPDQYLDKRGGGAPGSIGGSIGNPQDYNLNLGGQPVMQEAPQRRAIKPLGSIDDHAPVMPRYTQPQPESATGGSFPEPAPPAPKRLDDAQYDDQYRAQQNRIQAHDYGRPQNIGEGLTAIGEAIRNRATDSYNAGQARERVGAQRAALTGQMDAMGGSTAGDVDGMTNPYKSNPYIAQARALQNGDPQQYAAAVAAAREHQQRGQQWEVEQRNSRVETAWKQRQELEFSGQQRKAEMQQRLAEAQQYGMTGDALKSYVLAGKLAGGGGNDLSVTPQWGVGADGKPVLLQLGPDGVARQTALPEGVRLDPGQINQEKAAGTAYGKEVGEKRAGMNKAVGALNAYDAKVDNIDALLSKAIKTITDDDWTTGWAGRAASLAPGTSSFDLASTLDTIRAFNAFDELQTMRANSPTGGALGSVTERELAFLANAFANIEQGQSAEQLKDSLTRLRANLQGSRERLRSSFDRDYSGEGAALGADATTPPSPAAGDIVRIPAADGKPAMYRQNGKLYYGEGPK